MALAVGDGLSATDRPWHTGQRRSWAMAWARTDGDRDGWLRPAPPITRAATTTAASAIPGRTRRITVMPGPRREVLRRRRGPAGRAGRADRGRRRGGGGRGGRARRRSPA